MCRESSGGGRYWWRGGGRGGDATAQTRTASVEKVGGAGETAVCICADWAHVEVLPQIQRYSAACHMVQVTRFPHLGI
jgi:hypothetical protein